jgi:membrane protease YdiL (CAAX protease family)
MFDRQPGIPHQKHPVINLIIILLMMGLGFVVIGPLLGFFLAMPFFDGSMTELAEAVQRPMNHPEIRIPLYLIQGTATATGLILAPAVYLAREQRSLRAFFTSRGLDLAPVAVTVITVVVFMAVNSVFIEWNAKVVFPEFAKGFEEWARQREDAAAEITHFLTEFSSTGQLLLALVVIAVLPAIGEEIVFRGLIQNELVRATRNVHVAIWLAAVLFSAIHFQFFGFIPRVLLGALFGYLYYWSGNLLLAIIAHFVNNAVSLIALYYYQQGKFSFDIESQEAAPAPLVILSLILTAGLLYYFYKYYRDRQSPVNS